MISLLFKKPKISAPVGKLGERFNRNEQERQDTLRMTVLSNYYEMHKDQAHKLQKKDYNFVNKFDLEKDGLAVMDLGWVRQKQFVMECHQQQMLRLFNQIDTVYGGIGTNPYPPPVSKDESYNYFKRVQERVQQHMTDTNQQQQQQQTSDTTTATEQESSSEVSAAEAKKVESSIFDRQDIRDIFSPFKEGEIIKHPDGFGIQIRKSRVDHPESGYGLFVKGRVLPGTILAFYPGTIYYFRDLTPEVTNDNDHMISRYDQSVIDGSKWAQEATRAFAKLSALEYATGATNIDIGVKKYRNPFGIGQYINHPPKGIQPNILQYEFSFMKKAAYSASLEGTHLQPFIPHHEHKPHWLYSYDRTILSRSLVCVASRMIEDEELFMNYRYNPANPYPDWYSQPNPEEAARRWAPRKVFWAWWR